MPGKKRFKRPAEWGGGIAGAVAGLVCKVFGVEDADTFLYLSIVIGATPAAITWMVKQWRGEDA